MSQAASSIDDLVAALAERSALAFSPATDDGRRALAEIVSRLDDDAPEAVLGAAHEASLGLASRRASGSHYTPRSIVRKVIDGALDAADCPPSVHELRLLDPALGGGAFVCEALRRIIVRFSLEDTPQTRRLVATSCLFGVDRDAKAAHAARRALWLAVADPTLAETAFDATLVVDDALTMPWSRWPRFHLVVGNPPYLGGKRIRTVHGDAYANALRDKHPGTNKNCDLAAHFLRLAFDLLGPGGALGFVVTNTIAQGDTREGGVAHVLRNGGRIARAERRMAWPGAAGVVTSLVWIKNGTLTSPACLDGEPVDGIDAFLTPHQRTSDPQRLDVMKGKAFIGCFLRGTGFVFDDHAPGGPTLAERDAILAARPESRAFVRPFIGGREVMTDPAHAPHRSVIHFGAASLEQAGHHPELLAIVEQNVRPFREGKRATSADAPHRAKWWQFANRRPQLERALYGLQRAIVLPRVTSQIVAVRVATDAVFSDQLVVVASDSAAVLAFLCSRVHGTWAHLTCSTLGDGLRYTPSDVFETLPLPFASFAELERDERLGALGEAFEAERARLLRDRNIGLSKLFKLLMEPTLDAELGPLVATWVAIDRAVLNAFGWHDLPVDWHVDARRRFGFQEATRRMLIRRLLSHNDALLRKQGG